MSERKDLEKLKENVRQDIKFAEKLKAVNSRKKFNALLNKRIAELGLSIPQEILDAEIRTSDELNDILTRSFQFAIAIKEPRTMKNVTVTDYMFCTWKSMTCCTCVK